MPHHSTLSKLYAAVDRVWVKIAAHFDERNVDHNYLVLDSRIAMKPFVCFAFFCAGISVCCPVPGQQVSGQAANWAAFRGDGSSVTTHFGLPTNWGDEKNISWKLDLPGYGQSSPVIWGHRVFATTMQGATKEIPTIVCAHLGNGKEIWKREYQSTLKIKASDYVTRSSPTPAVDGNHVYAFFESGELVATDHDGNPKWQRSLVDEYGPFKGNHGVGSSLAISNDSIFVLVAHDGPSYLLAVNKNTGENIWKTDLDPKVSWNSPVVAGNQVIVSMNGSVRSFSVDSGKPVWSVDKVEGNTVASATVHKNVAFIGSSARENNFAVEFDATGKSQESKVVWRNGEVTSSFGSPLFYEGCVYYVNKKGVAYCVDAATGKTKWNKRLNGSSWASPIGVRGKVYFFSKEGVTDVLEVGDEPNIVATNKLSIESRIYGVAVSTNRLVIRTGSKLICVGGESNVATESKGPVEDENSDDSDAALTLPDCPAKVTSFGAAVCNGYLYVYGGNMGGAHSYSSEGQNGTFRRIQLKPNSQWESLGEVPKRQGLALVAHNGKLYRIGGFEATNAKGEDQVLVSRNDFSVYDPDSGKWTDLIPLPEPRSSFDAVVAGDMLYVIGGWALQEDGSESKWHETAWRINLCQTNLKWESTPKPPGLRRANSVAEIDGKIYSMGGLNDDGDISADTFVFDPETNKWSDAPAVPGETMDGFGSSSFNVGGRLILSTFSGQVLQLSKDGKQWDQIHELEPGRFFHRLVAIDNQRFLILGGTSHKGGKQPSVVVLNRENPSE